MSLPVIKEGASPKELAEALRSAAHDTIQLRNKATAGELTDEDRADFRSKKDFIQDVDVMLRAVVASEEHLREPSKSQGPSVAHDTPAERQRSLSEQVTESEEYKNFARNRTADADFRDFKVNGNVRTLLTTSTADTSSAGGWMPVAQPMAPRPRQQRLFVTDLIAQMDMTTHSLPYIIESTPTTTEGGATAVAEGQPKPEVEMDFATQLAVATKIAAWVPATTEIIEDAPALRGYIDNRLLYMLELRKEKQILFGSGVGPNLKGVLTWNSGPYQNQSQTAVSGYDLPAGVGLAIGKVANVDLDADGAVFNPLDYWQAATTRRSTQFDNGFGGNAPAVLSSLTWGLPAVTSRSMTSGNYAVGAWQLGATVANREGATIRVGNQHSDYFVTNKVAILIEARLALLTHRPDAFVNGVLSA